VASAGSCAALIESTTASVQSQCRVKSEQSDVGTVGQVRERHKRGLEFAGHDEVDDDGAVVECVCEEVVEGPLVCPESNDATRRLVRAWVSSVLTKTAGAAQKLYPWTHANRSW
jgi:hypothetical protein